MTVRDVGVVEVVDISYGFEERLKELAEHEPELIAELLSRKAEQRADNEIALGLHVRMP